MHTNDTCMDFTTRFCPKSYLRSVLYSSKSCTTKYFTISSGANVKRNLLEGHTDAVWGLAVQTNSLQLLSCSSDGTCKLWNPTLKSPLLNTFLLDKGNSWLN